MDESTLVDYLQTRRDLEEDALGLLLGQPLDLASFEVGHEVAALAKLSHDVLLVLLTELVDQSEDLLALLAQLHRFALRYHVLSLKKAILLGLNRFDCHFEPSDAVSCREDRVA